MSSLDELIRQTLADEAQNAPAADELIARVLREEPRRSAQRSSWLVPLGIAAVLALLITLTALWPHAEETVPAPPVTTDKPAPDDPGSGYRTLSAGAVHIALPLGGLSGAYVQSAWSPDCTLVLQPLDGEQDACATTPGGPTTYEVVVGSGHGRLPTDADSQRWDSPVHRETFAWNLSDPPSTDCCAGRMATVRSVSGEVRYDCVDACQGSTWKARALEIEYFPEVDGYVEMVAPSRRALDWLRDYVYVTGTAKAYPGVK